MSTRPDYSLPETGFVRLKQLVPHIIPFSASTLWRKVKDLEFPAPIKLSPGVTAWHVADVRQWLEAHGVEISKLSASSRSRLDSADNAASAASAIKPSPSSSAKTRALQAQLQDDRFWEAELTSEVKAWRDCESIRAYVTAVLARASANGEPFNQELQAWAQAALSVASRLDPTPSRIAAPLSGTRRRRRLGGQ
ncbi:AlpA family transcriptional regulator [Massilia sp. CCM 8734]|uniref:helix-turn-helix transcriptional regulator n=1 Tax=Massilia sp. CCM 8734 TaxID=2609283 RepID=UPI00142215CF|nr:AlpA family phage regulatory protein [Massilia sp. CCM 8734]NIA00079.1 AlpA family phage regulatory protein [Massilia sp. CCM 8734]